MADNYLEKRYEETLGSNRPKVKRIGHSVDDLLKKNRSIRGYKKNYKVSKFLFSDDSLIYWYCDIIDYTYDNEGDEYVFRDLLADVIVFPDGFVKVVAAGCPPPLFAAWAATGF